MAEVEDKLLDSSYDGIREYDNPMPSWWVWLFIITIIWSVGYLLYYDISGIGDTQLEEYKQELAMAEEKYGGESDAAAEQFDIVLLDDKSNISEGEQVYKMNCASCHGQNGGGGVGPNLTDKYWIHGGSFGSIVQTIEEGVPEKGMISWKPILSNKQIAQVASYIDQKLRGTSVPDGKEPEGEVYKAE